MLTESAGLRQPDQAAFVVTEQIAQHRARMFAHRGRGHWIHKRRARIADRQRHIWDPTHLRVRDPRHESTFPRLGRTNGLAESARPMTCDIRRWKILSLPQLI